MNTPHILTKRMQALFVCLVLWAGAAVAQTHSQGVTAPNFNEDTSEKSKYSREKKTPSFFHRPTQKTPAKQLALARKMAKKGKLRKATDLYDDLVYEWHNSPEAIQAQYELAQVLMKREKYTKAFKEFQYLIDHYAGQFDYDKVLDYQLKIARQVLTDRWGNFLFFKGFETPENALPLFEQIIKNAPNWEKTPGARLKMGITYEQTHQYEDAIASFDSVQQYSPFSDEAETALFHKARCLYTLAKKYPRDEKRCRAAISALTSFVTRYKMNPHKAETEQYLDELKRHLADMYYERAFFYDKKKRYKSAIIAYNDFLQKFPSSDRAQAVYARVNELKSRVDAASKE